MVDNGPTLDRDDVRRILDERARVLARPATTDEPGHTMVLAVLRLGGEQYGIDLFVVREVRRCEAITPLPGTPEFWSGLVNVRGRLLPVLDLAHFLEVPEAGASEERVLICVEAANFEVALTVDGMPEIRRVRHDEIGPPVYQAADLRRTHVQGVTTDLLTLLDLPALLADPRLVVHAT